jgi:hypothetical protein
MTTTEQFEQPSTGERQGLREILTKKDVVAVGNCR